MVFCGDTSFYFSNPLYTVNNIEDNFSKNDEVSKSKFEQKVFEFL